MLADALEAEDKSDTTASKSAKHADKHGKAAARSEKTAQDSTPNAQNAEQQPQQPEAETAALMQTQAQIDPQPPPMAVEQAEPSAQIALPLQRLPQTAAIEAPAAPAQKTQTAQTAETLPPIKTGAAETPAPAAQNGQVILENPAQQKFDDMLARAAQELEKGKAAITPAEGEHPAETAAEPEPVQQNTTPAATTEAAAEKPAMEPKAETPDTPVQIKTASAEALTGITTPKTEQKPPKEAPKTDELAVNPAQQKVPEPKLEVKAPEAAAEMQNPVRVPDQTEQIRAQLIKNLEIEKMEFNMQLKPVELGKIDVKMVLETGKLTVEIAAQEQKSVALLSKQTESLIASLRASGIELTSVNVVQASAESSAHMDSAFNLLSNTGGRHGAQTQNGGNGAATQGNSVQGDENADAEKASAAPQRLLNYAV